MVDNNYNKYKRKILTLVQNHDSNSLTKHLFWKPHTVLSIIVNGGGAAFYPLFIQINKQFGVINPKFVLFFLNCLFFHSFVMLEESDNKENKFLQRYFTWGHARYSMGDDTFYGIPMSSIVASSTQSSIVNLILKKEYTKVFTFLDPVHVCYCIVFLVLYCVPFR